MPNDPLMRWEWEGGAVRSDERFPPSSVSVKEAEPEPGCPEGEPEEPNDQAAGDRRSPLR
jgi:hypothetical protein